MRDVRVASFTVLNDFTILKTPGRSTTRAMTREADPPAEFDRQHAEIAAALTALGADIVGLMEIENDADDIEIDTLAAAFNVGAPPYQQ